MNMCTMCIGRRRRIKRETGRKRELYDGRSGAQPPAMPFSAMAA